MPMHQINGINIRTTNIFPPIPIRQFDWSAINDDTYDGEGCPIGTGATEKEAIEDLLEQIQDEDIVNHYFKTNGQFGMGA